MPMIAADVVAMLLESPDIEKLKKHRQALTPEEKASIPKDLASGDCATVLKGVVDGKTWYACYTHRSCKVAPTMQGMLRHYRSVAATA